MSNVVQPGDILAGSYRVERPLGEGGMGVVVAARLVDDDDRLVALKFMLPQALSFPQAAQRFIREGRVLQRFHGENLTHLLDSGTLDNGAPYFAMEYVDGVDLSKLVRQYGALSVTDSVDFMLQACRGVLEVHGHGVVHRDLKPGNLLVTQREDGSPLIKVIDFGLSKILAEEEEDARSVSQTQTTGTMGSPAFMSPEQARSAKYVDERADIWSLGAILYYLLSANLPFQAQATAEAFAKVLYDDPVPLREMAPWVPPALAEVVLRCLEKDPDERFQVVDDLAAAIAPFGSEGDYTYKPRPGDSVVVAGPKDLDIGSVIQQRTSITFDTLEVALGSHLSGETLAPMGRTTTRKRHRTLIAAIGMVISACVIIGVAIFLARGGDSAAASQEAPDPRSNPTDPVRVSTDPGSASAMPPGDPRTTGNHGDSAGVDDVTSAGSDEGAEGDTGDEGDESAEGGESAEGDDGDELDVGAGDASAKKSKRRRNRKGKRRGKRRRQSTDADDPFGTML